MDTLNSDGRTQQSPDAISRAVVPISCPIEAMVVAILNMVLFGLAAVLSLLALVGAFTVDQRDGGIIFVLIATLVFSGLGLLLGFGLLLKNKRAYRFAVLHLSYGRVVVVFLFVWVVMRSILYPLTAGKFIIAAILLFAFGFCWAQVHLLNRERVYQYFQ